MPGIGQSAAQGASIGGTVGSVVPGVGTAIGAGAGALIGGAFGVSQYLKGKKLEKGNVRPTYEIPQEIYQNLSQAQQQALQGLPEEQKQQYISNLQRSTGYALGQAGTRKAGLAGISAINEQQNKGYLDLATADAAARMENQKAVYGYRQNLADYKDQAWKVNKFDPYGLTLAKSEALKGSGIQNVGNAVQLGIGALGAADNAGLFNKKPQVAGAQISPNYVTPNNSYNRGYQTGVNANNYYNPMSTQSQSGTIVPDNYNQYNNIG